MRHNAKPSFTIPLGGRSAAHQLFMELRIASPFKLDLRRSLFEGAYIAGGEFDRRRSKVFFKASRPRCAGDRNDPWLLRKQPGECDLSRRYFPLLCERTH